MFDTTPEPDMLQARIAQLFIYPVKSCAGLALQGAQLTETGLDLDRAWMVVDAQGRFVSQRDFPRMALIRPQLRLSELVLRAPGMLALHLRLDTVEAPTQVEIWGQTHPAYDMGNLAAQWFSDFLAPGTGTAGTGVPYRLVRFDPEHRRLSDTGWTRGAEALNQFSDGYPLLIVGCGSLDMLNERLAASGHSPVGIERFRPNLVLSGLEAHDEDRIGDLHIDTPDGPVVLRPVKPCPRCPIPDIDPMTAARSTEVGDTLRTYRQDRRVDGAISFGMNAIIIEGGERMLRVGQAARARLRFED